MTARLVAALLLAACSSATPPEPPRAKGVSAAEKLEQRVDDCLNLEDADEPDSPLWDHLAGWASKQSIAGTLPEPAAQRLLDAAAKAVPELKAAADWRSAGRYFQAENFHALARPACRRGLAQP